MPISKKKLQHQLLPVLRFFFTTSGFKAVGSALGRILFCFLFPDNLTPLIAAMPAGADTVHAVSLKLPSFWSKNPRGWFRTIESSFGLRNITTSLTKYHYVVSTLDEDTSSRITDLIDAPPAADPYAAIKDQCWPPSTPLNTSSRSISSRCPLWETTAHLS